MDLSVKEQSVVNAVYWWPGRWQTKRKTLETKSSLETKRKTLETKRNLDKSTEKFNSPLSMPSPGQEVGAWTP